MKKLTISLVALIFLVAACADDSGPPRPQPPRPEPDVITDVEGPTDVVDDVTDEPEVTPGVETIEDVADDTGDEDTPSHDADTEPAPSCEVDADCDDSDPCTTGECVDGRCLFQLKDCTPPGADECDLWYCDPETGDCMVQENAKCAPLCTVNLDICDDGNPCTTHTCDETRGCVYHVAEGPCDNGNPCTVDDQCAADPTGAGLAICQAGEYKSCDDEDPCTINWCDPTFPEGSECRELELVGLDDCEVLPCPGGEDDECPVIANPCIEYVCNPELLVCESQYTNNPCDTNNPCTTNDRCEEGICVGGPPLNCDDGNFCTTNACIPERGGCVNTPIPDCRLPCETAADCPVGGNPCLRAVCTPAGLCQTRELTGPCDNGDPCTVGDRCEDGRCVGGSPLNCEDGRFCTRTSCDPSVPGGCVSEQIPGCREEEQLCSEASHCNDGDPCTTNTCLQYLTPTVCTAMPQPYCSCNPNAPDGGHGACDRGDPCLKSTCEPNNNPDIPHAGLCTPPIFDERCCLETCDPEDNTCDDGDKCTENLCEESVAIDGTPIFCCYHPPIDWPCGKPCTDLGEISIQCNDGEFCTDNVCGEDGTCNPPVFNHDRCQCLPGTVTDDCAHLIDDNPCTEVTCQSRQCRVIYNTLSCDDGDACTFNTYCSEGECVGDPIDCDDGEFCTDNFCDSDTGCYWQWNFEREGCEEQHCTDDEECRHEDLCVVGSCEEGRCVFRHLNDGHDSPMCYPMPCGEPAHCDDGNPCTSNICVKQDAEGETLPFDERVCLHEIALGCTTPPALVCDQSNDCQPLLCQPQYETAFCTSNGCVDTLCDEQVGCRFLPTRGCDFGRECTPENAHVDCWDGDPCTVKICTEDYLCDTSQAPYDPADNLWLFCNPCTNDLPCDPTGQPWDSENTCVEYHCRQFPPLDPRDEESGLGVCWAEMPELPVDIEPNLWDSCEYCSPAEPCDPADQSFVAGEPCAGHFCRPLGDGFGDQGICWAELPTYEPTENLWQGCRPCSEIMDCDPTGQDFYDTNPCANYYCRQVPLPNSPDGATVGICWAEVDYDIYPDLCEDYDLCTANICLPEGGCANEPWPGFEEGDCRLCGSDRDCDDFNRCTVGECVDDGFRCEFHEIEDCFPCDTQADCPPDEGCEMYGCDRGKCYQLFVDVCVPADCSAAAGILCDDGDPATIGFCLEDTGDCVFFPADRECDQDADCFHLKGDPCNDIACVDGICSDPVPRPDCTPTACSDSSDCAGLNRYPTYFCLDGLCWGVGTEMCTTHTECLEWEYEDSWPDPCALPACHHAGYCRHVTYGTYARCSNDECESDADCAPRHFFPDDPTEYSFCLTTPDGEFRCYDWPCARGYCVVGKNRCLWFEGDCTGCGDDLDCFDGDPCTESTCVEGECVHTPIVDCAPVACDEFNPCDSGDPCTLGVCLSTGCFWLPDPTCD